MALNPPYCSHRDMPLGAAPRFLVSVTTHRPGVSDSLVFFDTCAGDLLVGEPASSDPHQAGPRFLRKSLEAESRLAVLLPGSFWAVTCVGHFSYSFTRIIVDTLVRSALACLSISRGAAEEFPRIMFPSFAVFARATFTPCRPLPGLRPGFRVFDSPPGVFCAGKRHPRVWVGIQDGLVKQAHSGRRVDNFQLGRRPLECSTSLFIRLYARSWGRWGFTTRGAKSDSSCWRLVFHSLTYPLNSEHYGQKAKCMGRKRNCAPTEQLS